MTCDIDLDEKKPSDPSVRLLVIDDDLIQRTVIARIGAQSGYETVVVDNFKAAETALTAELFDCVTLDLSLGEQSGALLLRTIAESSNNVPVIVISGAEQHVLSATVRLAQGLDLDCSQFSKPLSLQKFRELLIEKKRGAVARRGVNYLNRLLQKSSEQKSPA